MAVANSDKCLYCARPITRKRHSKRFCGDSCRKSYHTRKRRIKRQVEGVSGRMDDLLASLERYPDLTPEIAAGFDSIFRQVNYARQVNPLTRFPQERMETWLKRINTIYERRHRQPSPLASARLAARPAGLGVELRFPDRVVIFDDPDHAGRIFLTMLECGVLP